MGKRKKKKRKWNGGRGLYRKEGKANKPSVDVSHTEIHRGGSKVGKRLGSARVKIVVKCPVLMYSYERSSNGRLYA